MAIGTSLGQWFPDQFSHATQNYQFSDKDNNVIDPDLEGNEPTANDKNIIDPVTKTPDFISEAGYKTPNTNFNDRFSQPGSTGELTPEDLQRAGLSYRGVDDRTNETMMDQISANASALKQWGHNLIHPDPTSDVPQDNFNQANKDLNLNPREQALYQRHLTNLYGSGGVDNPDGSRSTLYQSVQKGPNGQFYNIPTVWDGARETQPYTRPSDNKTFDVPNDKAISNVEKEGWDKFPSYSDPDIADKRYDAMHQYMEKDTASYNTAKELGYNNIKPDPELEKHSDMKLMYDKVVNDALSTGRIFKGMYEGLKKDLSSNK